MRAKELCLELAYCENERSVINALKEQKLWDNSDAWHYYGGNENNFATVGNQQSRPEFAVVEKLINSVDAMLMARCMKNGIDPEGPRAPDSISEALREYFNIYDGKLSNLNPKDRRTLAENICLVATGTKSNPCYAIIDKGEGQTPTSMPETLLSLAKSNKLRIPFVQGKFNMGGTGVLRFCGKHNLQLIISKRNPEVARHENGESSDKWGFTLVRREDPQRGTRSSTYRYLAPDQKIISFRSNGLRLLPGDYPDPYGNELPFGTYIKLYEYQMTGLRTNILFDLYNRLSLLVPTIALPVRLYERRKGYTGHSMETTLSGLTVRLEEDKRENLETGFPTSTKLVAQGEKMKASIFVFKRNQSQKYTKNEGIIFTVNGQTHAHLSRAFFSRKNVGMGYLADSMLVIVDCSEITPRAREDLFMNSRDRLGDGNLKSDIERNLEKLLKDHQGLRDLRESRRREEIEEKIGDSKPLADVIEDILRKSPSLSKLFLDGVRIPNPFKLKKGKRRDDYLGKEYPTQFKLIKAYPPSTPKKCPLNQRFKIQYRTDATNDYFTRDRDPGTFSLTTAAGETPDYSLSLWNGTATLYVHLPSSTEDGELIRFDGSITDVSRIEPFEETFYVRIMEPVKKRKGQPGKSQKPPSQDDEGDDGERTSDLDLPMVTEVRRESWSKHSFDDESALRVVDSGTGGYDFFVNMDNIFLLSEQKSNPDNPKLLEARYKYGVVLIGIALLKDDASKGTEKHREDDDEGEDICQKISNVSRAVSPVLLPMIATLGDLKLEEVASTFEED